MDIEETDLTLYEQGLDAVGDFLKGVVDEKPETQSLEERKIETSFEEPIDNEA